MWQDAVHLSKSRVYSIRMGLLMCQFMVDFHLNNVVNYFQAIQHVAQAYSISKV